MASTATMSANTTQHDDISRSKWVDRVAQQGPWDELADPLSLAGAPSLPMPVTVSDKQSLAPFFAHLGQNGTHEPAVNGTTGVEPFYNVETIEFEKGVLYADGRVDLCKMVLGPRNIGDLMDSLKSNTFAKHFLLGNNIIGGVGARAIADFINEFPDRFETWYLAGNCVDATGFSILVDSMVKSSVITNIWLKRNPLKRGAISQLFRLITQSPSLRTLDLDQTELGDDGVAELFSLLVQHDQPVALRHIYLNACGVGRTACQAISDYLSTHTCQLESLYISDNPIGDAVALLAPGLKVSTTLTRISLQSCGLKDSGTIALLNAAQDHQSLKVLDIGQAYATEDLGVRFNWLTDASSDAVADLINSTRLQYLSISHTPMTQAALNKVYKALINSSSILWFHGQPLVKGGKSYAEVKAGQESARLVRVVRERLHQNVAEQYDGMSYEAFDANVKRFLLSPKDVRFIDSVYRNRDAGQARRGLKPLQKWWDEDDETLLRVAEGYVD